MSDITFPKIAVIGLGLIGSSLVRVAHEAKLAKEICVTDKNEDVRAKAVQLGLGDKVVGTAREAVEDADLVVLAVPVGAMALVAEEISPALKAGAVVIDTGSTKGSVMRDVKPFLPASAYFVPTHPIAGTEYSGPEAGFSSLFRDRYWIVLPEDNPAEVVERIRVFLAGTGALVEDMTVEYHDRVLAITSHLPHLIAYTIVGTAFDFEQQIRNDVIRFSASGFRDFTRIAASDPIMWRDVFLNNSDAVLEMLGRFNEDLAYLQRAIRWKEGDKLEELFSRTREIRNRIKDIGQLD
ncbi:MAG: prephenate/arogenate dehydrogenase family protein [Alphaproteobacteria bacterium]|nr:prephenate/arogenate dehydrogenase family protein [Alphaproteobacteria bacterium]